VPQGEESVSGMVFGVLRKFSSNTLQWRHTDTYSCVKNRQYFRTHGIPSNSALNSLSYDIVRFKIEVGVDAKFTCKNVSKHMRRPLSSMVYAANSNDAISRC